MSESAIELKNMEFKISGLSTTEIYYDKDANDGAGQFYISNDSSLTAITAPAGVSVLGSESGTFNRILVDYSAASIVSGGNSSITLTDLKTTKEFNDDNIYYQLALGEGYGSLDTFHANIANSTLTTASNNRYLLKMNAGGQSGFYVTGSGSQIRYSSNKADSLQTYLGGLKTGLSSADIGTNIIIGADKSIVLSNSVLGDNEVTISNKNYTLGLASDVNPGGVYEAHFEQILGASNAAVSGAFKYQSDATYKGYKVTDGQTITYYDTPQAATTLFTLTGLSDATSIAAGKGSLAGIQIGTIQSGQAYITVSESGILGSASANKPTVLKLTDTEDDAVTYKLGIGISGADTSTSAKNYSISVAGNSVTASLGSYYYLANDSVLTHYADDTDTFTVSGISSGGLVKTQVSQTSAFDADNNETVTYNITLYKNNLNKTNVTVTPDSTNFQNANVVFIAGSDVDTSSNPTSLQIESGTAGGNFTLTPAGGDGGYIFAGGSTVTYTGNHYGGTNDQFVISGLSSDLTDFSITSSGDTRTISATKNGSVVAVGTYQTTVNADGTASYLINLAADAFASVDGQTVALTATAGESTSYTLQTPFSIFSASAVSELLTHDSVNGFLYVGSYSSAYFGKDESVSGNVKQSYTYHRDTGNTTPHFAITTDSSLESIFGTELASAPGSLSNISSYVSLTAIDSLGYVGVSLGQTIMNKATLDGFKLTLTDTDTTDDSITPYFVDPDGDAESLKSGYARMDSDGTFKFLVPGSASGWLVSDESSVVTYQHSKGDLFTIEGLQGSLSTYTFTLTDNKIVGASGTDSVTLATYAADGDNYTVKLYKEYVGNTQKTVVLTRGEQYTNASIGFSIIDSEGAVVADIGSQSNASITFGQIRNGVLNASIGVAQGTFAMTKNTGEVTEYTHGGTQSAIFSLSGLDSKYVLYDASLDAAGNIVGYYTGQPNVTLGTINRDNGIVTLTDDAFKKTNGEFITGALTLTDSVEGDLTYQLSLASAENDSYQAGRYDRSSLTSIDGGYIYVNGGLQAGYSLAVSALSSTDNTATTSLTYIPSPGGQTFSLTGGVASGLTTADLIGGASGFTTTLSNANKDFYITNAEDEYDTYYALQAGTYVLTENLSLESILSVNGDTVIDLNGHTISIANNDIGSMDGAIKVSGYNLTILDSGNTTGGISAANGNAIFVENGKLIVNGGEIKGALYGIRNTTGNVVINDGTITSSGDTASTSGGIIQASTGNVVINGGVVNGGTSGNDGIKFEFGKLYVYGGSVSGIANGINITKSNAEVNIAGGTVKGGTSYALNVSLASDVNITGGTIDGNIFNSYASVTVDISGGSFTGNLLQSAALNDASVKGYTVLLDEGTASLYTAASFSGMHLVEGLTGISAYLTTTNSADDGTTLAASVTAAAAPILIGDGTITINNAAINGTDDIVLTSTNYSVLAAGSDVSRIGEDGKPSSLESAATWSNITVGTITYTADKYAAYWASVPGNAKTLHNYSAAGGESFNIEGLYDVNNPGHVKWNVNVSQSGTLNGGQYSITGYTFTAGQSLLDNLAQGNTISLTSDYTGTYGFSFASVVNTSSVVGTAQSVANISLNDGYSSAMGVSAVYTYATGMTSRDYFSIVGGTNDRQIKHYAQVGGQAFTITGLSLGSTAGQSFKVTNGNIYIGSTSKIAGVSIVAGTGTDSIGYVELQSGAFAAMGLSKGYSIKITDLDMKDGINYVWTIGSGMTPYESYDSASFAAVKSGEGYDFFSKGSESGQYKIETTDEGGEDATQIITNMGASNSYTGFNIKGLSTVFGLSTGGYASISVTNDTLVTAAGTSGTVTIGALTKDSIFTIYNDALAGQSINLASFDGSDTKYELSLGADVQVLDSNNTPSITSASLWSSVSDNDSITYTAAKYSDYYTLDKLTGGASIANYYQSTGGASFVITGLSGISGDAESLIKNGVTVNLSISSAAANNGQYSVTAYNFELGAGLLLSLPAGKSLTFNYALSGAGFSLAYSEAVTLRPEYTDKTSPTYIDRFSSITAASIEGSEGEYTYTAGVSTSDHYALEFGNSSASVIHYAKEGGQPFVISGLSTGLGALSVAGNSIFTNNGTLIGSIVSSNVDSGNASNDSISYVYLTKEAFAAGGNTITLTDSVTGDGVLYQLALDRVDSNNLLDSYEYASVNGASSATISAMSGTLTYTTAKIPVYASLDASGASSSGVTKLTYIASQSAAQAFTLSGIDSVISNASIDGEGNITAVKGEQTIKIGSLSGTTLSINSTAILSDISKSASLTFADDETEADIYQLSLGEVFRLNNPGTGDISLTPDASNPGTYTYTRSGAVAYTSLTSGESVLANNGDSAAYVYTPAQNGSFMISGLKEGLTLGDSLVVSFGQNGVTINSDEALPDGQLATTIKVVGNTGNKDIAPALTFATVFTAQGDGIISGKIQDQGSVSGDTLLTAPVYMPHYQIAGTSIATVYQSYGGDQFTLTGNWASLMGFQNDTTNLASGIVDSYTGSRFGSVSITPDSAGGASYIFTIENAAALGKQLSDFAAGESFGIINGSASYSLVINEGVFETNASAVESVGHLDYVEDLQEHVYTAAGRGSYFEPDSSIATQVHEYYYRGANGKNTFTFDGLNQVSLTSGSIGSGSAVLVDEIWTDGSIASVDFYIAADAMQSAPADGTSITASNSDGIGYSLFLSQNNALSSAHNNAGLSAISGGYTFTAAETTSGYYESDDKQALVYTTQKGADVFSLSGNFANSLTVDASGSAIVSLTGMTQNSAGSAINTYETVGTISEDGIVLINSSLAYGSLSEGDTLSLMDADAGHSHITYKLSLTSNLVNNTVAADGKISLTAGETTSVWSYYAPAKTNYFVQSEESSNDKTTTTYTFHENSSSLAAFTLDGLDNVKGLSVIGNDIVSIGSSTVTVGAVDTSTGNVSLTTSLLNTAVASQYSLKTITLTDTDSLDGINYKLVLGNGVTQSSITGEENGTFAESSGTYTFTTKGNTAGWYINEQNTSVTSVNYNDTATGRKVFTFSGLKSGMGLAYSPLGSVSGVIKAGNTTIAGIGWQGGSLVSDASVYSVKLYDAALGINNVADGDTLAVGLTITDVNQAKVSIKSFELDNTANISVDSPDGHATIGEAYWNSIISDSVQTAVFGYESLAAWWDPTKSNENGIDAIPYHIYHQSIATSQEFSISGFSAGVAGLSKLPTDIVVSPDNANYTVNLPQSLTPNGNNGYYTLTITEGSASSAVFGTDLTNLYKGDDAKPTPVGAAFTESVGTYTYTAGNTPAYLNIDDNNKVLTWHNQQGGASFAITGLSSSLTTTDGYNILLGSATVGSIGDGNNASLKVFTLTDVSAVSLVGATKFGGGSASIKLTDGSENDDVTYSLALDSTAFGTLLTAANAAAPSIGGNSLAGADGSYTFNAEHEDKYTRGSVASNDYTYYAEAAYDTFIIGGLSTGLGSSLSVVSGSIVSGATTADSLIVGTINGQTITLVDSVLAKTEGASITFAATDGDTNTSYYTLTAPESRGGSIAADGFTSDEAGSLSFFKAGSYTKSGYDPTASVAGTVAGGTDSVTYTYLAASDAAFEISGLNRAITDATISGGTVTANTGKIGTLTNDTLTLNTTALPSTSLKSGLTITLTDTDSNDTVNYKLALLGGKQTGYVLQSFQEAEDNAGYTVNAANGLATVSATATDGFWSVTSADNTYTAEYNHFFSKNDTLFTVSGLSAAKASVIGNYTIDLVPDDNNSLAGYNVSIGSDMLSRENNSVISIGGGTGNDTLTITGNIALGENNATRTGADLSDSGVYSAGNISEYLEKGTGNASYIYHESVDSGVGFKLLFDGEALDGKNTYQLNTNRDIVTSDGKVLAHFDSSNNVVYIYDDGKQDFANGVTVSVTSTNYTKQVQLAVGTESVSVSGATLLDEAKELNKWSESVTSGTATYTAQQKGYKTQADSTNRNTALVYDSVNSAFDFSGLNTITAITDDQISVTSADKQAYTFTINDEAVLNDLAVGKSFSVSATADSSEGLTSTIALGTALSSLGSARHVAVSVGGNATDGYTYAAEGETDYYSGSGSSILTHVDKTGQEPFTISGLSDGVTTDNYTEYFAVGASGAVTLTEKAFEKSDTITLSDDTSDDVSYGLSLGTLTEYDSKGYAETLTGTDTTYNYKAAGTSLGYEISGTTSITKHEATGGTTFTLEGMTGLSLNENITVSGADVSINDVSVLGSVAAGETASFTFTDATGGIEDTVEYKLNLGADFNTVSAAPSAVEAAFTGTAGSYSFADEHTVAYTTGESGTYTYHAATAYDEFSISGLKTTGNLSLSGTNIIADGATIGTINDKAITLNENAWAEGATIEFNGDTDGNGTAYTLANPQERTAVVAGYSATDTAGKFTYTAGGSTAGFDVASASGVTTYTWQAAASAAFEIGGFSTTVTADGVAALAVVSGSAVTLSETAFNGTSSISLTDVDANDGIDYKLSNEGFSAGETIPETLTSANDIYTYTAEGKTAGYNFTESGATTTLTHEGATGGTSFTLEGLTADLSLGTDIAVNGANVSIDKVSALAITDGTATVKLTDSDTTDTVNYALSLGNEFNVGGTSTAAEAALDGQIYTAGAISAYTTEVTAGSEYVYNAGDSGISIEFSGLSTAAQASNITVSDDNVITFTAAEVGTGTVSVLTPNYSLSLGTLSKATTAPDGFQGTAYKTAGSTEGYKLDSASAISYVAAGGGSTLFEFVSGFAEGTELTLDGTDIKDGSEVVGSYTDTALATTKDAVKVDVTGLEGKAMTFEGFEEIAGFNAATQSLIADAPVDAAASNGNLIIAAGDDSITLDNLAGKNVTVLSGENTYKVNYSRITDNTDAAAQKATLTAGSTASIYAVTAEFVEFDATKATGKNGKLTLSATKNTQGVAITGASAIVNNIVGGSGADTIIGGSANDMLKGNGGADVFVQTAGTDTVIDYTEGEDVIQLASAVTEAVVASTGVVSITTAEGTMVVKNGEGAITTKIGASGTETTGLYLQNAPTDAEVSGSDLVVASGENKFTVTGAASKTVNVYTNEGNFTAGKTQVINVTDAAAKSVTLTSGNTSGGFVFNDSIAAVDASRAQGKSGKLTFSAKNNTNGVSIIGLSEGANNVVGGAGNDTFVGGSGNDAFKGGDGADLFIQSEGTDTVTDYTAGEDVIQLASEISNVDVASTGVVSLTTAEGTVVVKTDGAITTKIGEDGEETTAYYLNNAPTDATVSGSDLVITNGSETFTVSGAASKTVTVTTNEGTFTVGKTQIIDINDAAAKSVTLTSGNTSGGFVFNDSIAAVDASRAQGKSGKLTFSAKNNTNGVSIIGLSEGANNVVGGAGNDTFVGGSGNDAFKGGDGADLFIQSEGTDTVTDYTAGEDVIQLASEISNVDVASTGVVSLTTAEGTVVVKTDGAITTKIGEDGEETTAYYLNNAPTDATVSGSDLVITNGSETFTVSGAASKTVTVTTNEGTFTVGKTQIIDINDAAAKSVTLTSGNTSGGFVFNDSIAAVDASRAQGKSGKLTFSAKNNTNGVSIIGLSEGANNVIGGAGNDTFVGGNGDDAFKGGTGADLFIQSAGTDLITDYSASDNDIIELTSTPTIGTSGTTVNFVTAEGTLQVKDGKSQTITYRVGADGETQTYSASADIFAGNDNALWGTDDVKDTFVFDGGNDTIYNYGAEDEIALAGYSLTDLVNNAPAVSGSNVVFDFGGGNTLTVDGKAGSDINFSDGSTFTSDGNKYSKR